jgi:hypothetical protein
VSFRQICRATRWPAPTRFAITRNESEALRVGRIDIEIHDRDAAPPFHRTAKFCISLNGLATTRVGLFQPFG